VFVVERNLLDFELPDALEAHEPPEARGLARDQVRLLVSHRSDDAIEHRIFRDLPDVLRPGDLVVANDSATLAAGELSEIRSENSRLRALLGLGSRLGSGFVPAEVLHQATPTDPLTVVISAGSKRGVRVLAPVVAPDGLLGIVNVTEAATSVVATWAHPEFRASGMASDGSVYGILAPHGSTGGVWLLELSGVPYRQHIPFGTRILTSGLGGVLPRGIPIGTVVGTAGETEWDRTYLVRPAVPPGSVTHVMVLTSPRNDDLHATFAPDSTKAPP